MKKKDIIALSEILKEKETLVIEIHNQDKVILQNKHFTIRRKVKR